MLTTSYEGEESIGGIVGSGTSASAEALEPSVALRILRGLGAMSKLASPTQAMKQRPQPP